MLSFAVPCLVVLLTVSAFLVDERRPKLSTVQYSKGILAFLGGALLQRSDAWRNLVHQCEHREGQDSWDREIDCTGDILWFMWMSIEKAPFAYIVLSIIERALTSRTEEAITDKTEKIEATETTMAAEEPKTGAGDAKG